MRRKILLLAFIGSLAVGGLADGKAETARESFDTIPAQVRAEAEAAKKKGAGPQGTGQTDPNYLLGIFRTAKQYLEDGDETTAIQQLRTLQSAAASGPVQDLCETVIRKFRDERGALDAAASAEVAGILQRVGEAVVAAKAPKDLDAVLRGLAATTEKHGPGHARERNNELFNSRLQTATRFVARWQDYLLIAGRSDSRQAAESLRSLGQETETLQLLGIPRSEIIGRIPAPVPTAAEVRENTSRRAVPTAEINAAIDTAFNRLKTLDDLPAAIRDLTAFRDEAAQSSNGYGNGLNEVTTVLGNLQALQQAYVEVQAGINRWQANWPSRYDGSNNSRSESRLTVLRAQLIALSLPRLLGAPDTEKPAAGERVDAFLDRLMAAARKRGDWQAVATGVECRQMFAPNSAYMGGRSEANVEEVAFKQFFAGQNFEQAAQYPQAVIAYLNALSSGSQDLPVVVISQRLAAIKKDHPVDYQSADSSSAATSTEEELFGRRRYPVVHPPEPPEPLASPSPAASPTPTTKPSAAPTASPQPSPSSAGSNP